MSNNKEQDLKINVLALSREEAARLIESKAQGELSAYPHLHYLAIYAEMMDAQGLGPRILFYALSHVDPNVKITPEEEAFFKSINRR